MLTVIPEDRSKDAWIAATWKQEWEASGPTEYTATYRTLEKASRENNYSKTLDDPRQTAKWGRSVQSIDEDVGTGGQRGM